MAKTMAKTAEPATREVVTIKPPNLRTVALEVAGTTPLVINRFGNYVREVLYEKHKSGSTTRGKVKREPKDFEALYRDALHVSTEGWYGMNAGAFRQAAISACRLVGFKMTYAKLSIFIEADGLGTDGTPLVRLHGEPTHYDDFVRNADGSPDIRPRGHWNAWTATVRVRFDADQFTLTDIVNLFDRVGKQVGIGAGRPDSKNSAGQG